MKVVINTFYIAIISHAIFKLMYKHYKDSIFVKWHLFWLKASSTDVSMKMTIDYSYSTLKYIWELSIWTLDFKKYILIELKTFNLTSHKPIIINVIFSYLYPSASRKYTEIEWLSNTKF